MSDMKATCDYDWLLWVSSHRERGKREGRDSREIEVVVVIVERERELEREWVSERVRERTTKPDVTKTRPDVTRAHFYLLSFVFLALLNQPLPQEAHLRCCIISPRFLYLILATTPRLNFAWLQMTRWGRCKVKPWCCNKHQVQKSGWNTITTP